MILSSVDQMTAASRSETEATPIQLLFTESVLRLPPREVNSSTVPICCQSKLITPSTLHLCTIYCFFGMPVKTFLSCLVHSLSLRVTLMPMWDRLSGLRLFPAVVPASWKAAPTGTNANPFSCRDLTKSTYQFKDSYPKGERVLSPFVVITCNCIAILIWSLLS